MNNSEKLLVEALRSSEFNQIQGCLADGNGHCCLGVACEIAMSNGIKIKSITQNHVEGLRTFFNGEDKYLPSDVIKWLGWASKYGHLNYPYLATDGCKYGDLSEMNDSGISFNEIADVIEKGLVQHVQPSPD